MTIKFFKSIDLLIETNNNNNNNKRKLIENQFFTMYSGDSCLRFVSFLFCMFYLHKRKHTHTVQFFCIISLSRSLLCACCNSLFLLSFSFFFFVCMCVCMSALFDEMKWKYDKTRRWQTLELAWRSVLHHEFRWFRRPWISTRRIRTNTITFGWCYRM